MTWVSIKHSSIPTFYGRRIMSKPKIGLATNLIYSEGYPQPPVLRPYVNIEYVDAVYKAGGIPVMLPEIPDEKDIAAQIEGLDGIFLTGGWDINPRLYGEEPSYECGYILSEVDEYYMALLRAAHNSHLPVFGICKGMQAINVYYGGTITQDIHTKYPNAYQHDQKGQRFAPSHTVHAQKDSFVEKLLGSDTLYVNSHHHQAIEKVAPGFTVAARSDDGIVESIEGHFDDRIVCGVQWHPEMMVYHGDLEMLPVLEYFVDACRLSEKI